jgi:hypothetical protein
MKSLATRPTAPEAGEQPFYSELCFAADRNADIEFKLFHPLAPGFQPSFVPFVQRNGFQPGFKFALIDR